MVDAAFSCLHELLVLTSNLAHIVAPQQLVEAHTQVHGGTRAQGSRLA